MNFCWVVRKLDKNHALKYLGALIDQLLLCKYQINFLKQKLNTANGILAKLRHHLLSDILKTVYYYYACQIRFGGKATVTY